MQITDIKFRKLYTEGSLKAIISVTFDDCFVVHDIKIIEKPDKLILAMPSRKTDDGFKDVAHPINEKMRGIIRETLLEEYYKLLAATPAPEDDESSAVEEIA